MLVGKDIVCGCGQVHQERRPHIPPQGFATAVDAFVGRCADADVRTRLNDGVEVEFVAVGRLLDALIARGPHLFELPARGPDMGANGVEQGLGIGTVLGAEPLLVEPAPAAQVDAVVAVPLVVAETRGGGVAVAQRPPDRRAFHVDAALELIARRNEGRVDFAQLAIQTRGVGGGRLLRRRKLPELQGRDLGILVGERLVPIVEARLALKPFQRRLLDGRRRLVVGPARLGVQGFVAGDRGRRRGVDIGRRQQDFGREGKEPGLHVESEQGHAKRIEIRQSPFGPGPPFCQAAREQTPVAAGAGIATRRGGSDPGRLDHPKERPGDARPGEGLEEDTQVGLAQDDFAGGIRRKPRHPPTRRLDFEPVGSELPESDFVERRDAVERRVQPIVGEVVDAFRQVHGPGVVAGADAIAGPGIAVAAARPLRRPLRQGLDVHRSPRDAFGEQRQHPVDVGERGQGQTTSTIPATASWTLGSSDTASTMANWAARRGSMPRSMS